MLAAIADRHSRPGSPQLIHLPCTRWRCGTSSPPWTTSSPPWTIFSRRCPPSVHALAVRNFLAAPPNMLAAPRISFPAKHALAITLPRDMLSSSLSGRRHPAPARLSSLTVSLVLAVCKGASQLITVVLVARHGNHSAGQQGGHAHKPTRTSQRVPRAARIGMPPSLRMQNGRGSVCLSERRRTGTIDGISQLCCACRVRDSARASAACGRNEDRRGFGCGQAARECGAGEVAARTRGGCARRVRVEVREG